MDYTLPHDFIIPIITTSTPVTTMLISDLNMPDTKKGKEMKRRERAEQFYKELRTTCISNTSIEGPINNDLDALARRIRDQSSYSRINRLFGLNLSLEERLKAAENPIETCMNHIATQISLNYSGTIKRLQENFKHLEELYKESPQEQESAIDEIEQFAKDYKVKWRSGSMLIPINDYSIVHPIRNNIKLDITEAAIKLDPTKLPKIIYAYGKINTGYSGDYFHPHVNTNGEICLGDSFDAVEAACIRADLYSLLDIITGVLQTYNTESPYPDARIENLANIDKCSLCHGYVSRLELHKCKICNARVCTYCSKTVEDKTYCEKCFNELDICQTCSSLVNHTSTCDVCGTGICNTCGTPDPFGYGIICKDCIDTRNQELNSILEAAKLIRESIQRGETNEQETEPSASTSLPTTESATIKAAPLPPVENNGYENDILF
jgi:hypothetical protein